MNKQIKVGPKVEKILLQVETALSSAEKTAKLLKKIEVWQAFP
jgi:hypothetical protein